MDLLPYQSPAATPPPPAWLDADQQERAQARFRRGQAWLGALKTVILGALVLILGFILLTAGSPYSPDDPRNFLLNLGPVMQGLLTWIIFLPWVGALGRLLILGYDFLEFEILPVRCPHCWRIGNRYITRRAIPDTGRELLTCRHCEHTWYRAL